MQGSGELGAGTAVFAGGGEVGAEMARRDWAATPIGPPEEWPSLLKTQVRILLTSRFSMWMGWGPELAFFYNDAYRRDTLGVKHPWALGRSAREVWAEIWDDIGPRIVRVLTTGEATWDEALLLFLERSGFREETYHTFSYSPITEADGSIAGMLCVVSEETERVLGERRMTTLRELAADLATTRTEPEVLAAVERHLTGNARDLPFTLTYLFDGADARLAVATGIPAGHPAAPAVIPAGADDTWPVHAARHGNDAVVVEGLSGRFGALPAGAWDTPPAEALAVPLSQQGQPEPAGVLIVGLNPYRPLDAGYAGFVDLLAGQVASGIASARAYEAERERAEALAELDRAKTQFFSNVSHEFRTPLTLIAGPVEDALSDLGAPAEVQRERLEIIRRNAGRLRRLVNDLLDFSRIEAGRLQAEVVATDLADLTRDITVSFSAAVERAGLGLGIDCPPLARPVFVDRDMWEKVVLNLLSNALKFTLDGRIDVALRDAGDEVELTVADTGVGIAADQLPRLFQRFHRAPAVAARSHEGTGIGLALVAELVRLHGGTVSVASEEGRGTTFTVRLPYGAAPSPATTAPPRESSRQVYVDEALQWTAPETPAPVPARSVTGTTGDATVLVVDDNPDLRSYITRLLEPFWNVIPAADGVEAMAVARREHPELILTDVMMPRLDGFGLLRELRNDRELSKIPVIFLSARAGEEAAVHGLRAGADDYLVKPFSALELLARVRANLELARFRNQEATWRRALVESLDDGVVVADSAARVIEANPAFERILGFDADAVPYEPPYPWWPDPDAQPEEYGRMEEVLAQVLTGGQFQGTIPVYHCDGHRVVVDLCVTSIFEGEQRTFVTTFRDVTAELAAAEREAALARLGVALAEAGTVSEVDHVGLTELKAAFGAARALVVTWQRGSPSDDVWATLDDDTREAVSASRDEGGVIAIGPSGTRCRGVSAPVESGEDGAAAWLEFDPSRPFNPDDRALFGVLCRYLGQARRRAQLLDDSQAVATAMQRAILGPATVPGGVAVRYAPAVRPLEVGGDWYDAVELPDGRIGLVVGDCVGRGLSAATVMGQLRSACRALFLQTATPSKVIGALDSFAERIPGAACTTLLCAAVDRDSETVVYSCAGHVPGLVVGPDGATRILDGASSVPLAVVPGTVRPEATAPLPPGASLVLYTDGLIERRRERLDLGLERLAAAVRSGAGLGEDALADHVMGSLLPGGDQTDDVALVIYRQPSEPGPFRADIPADPAELAAYRRRLRHWLHERGADDQTITDVLIASGEAVANAVEHAYGFSADQTVEISVSLHSDRLEVVVRDHGGWKAPRTDEARGRGLPIIRALMEDVEIISDAAGTTVRLRKRLRRAG